jgi:hypothetical protein
MQVLGRGAVGMQEDDAVGADALPVTQRSSKPSTACVDTLGRRVDVHALVHGRSR